MSDDLLRCVKKFYEIMGMSEDKTHQWLAYLAAFYRKHTRAAVPWQPQRTFELLKLHEPPLLDELEFWLALTRDEEDEHVGQ